MSVECDLRADQNVRSLVVWVVSWLISGSGGFSDSSFTHTPSNNIYLIINGIKETRQVLEPYDCL